MTATWSVFNQDSGAEICFRADVCLEPDPTSTGHRVCRVAQLVLKSAAVRQQGGAHQRRRHQSLLLLQAGSSASSCQAEGRRSGENHGGQQIPLTKQLHWRAYLAIYCISSPISAATFVPIATTQFSRLKAVSRQNVCYIQKSHINIKRHFLFLSVSGNYRCFDSVFSNK